MNSSLESGISSKAIGASVTEDIKRAINLPGMPTVEEVKRGIVTAIQQAILSVIRKGKIEFNE